MLIYDHARQPVGGHAFKDPSSHVVEATTLKGLVSAIAQYRKNNGFAAGNPEAEVEIAYAKSHPWMVSPLGENPSVPLPAPFTSWVNRLWKNPPKNLRDDETAYKRLKVCKACPHYSESLAASTEDTRKLITLSIGRFIPHAGHCTKLHYACGIAVFTDPLPEDAPEGCWTLNGA